VQRLKYASGTLHVAALFIAVATSQITYGIGRASVTAAIIATVGVVVSFLAAIPFRDRPVADVTIIGVSITCFSVAAGLTGGLDSTYTLLPIATIFLASAGGGLRFAAPSAVAATVGVLLAALFAGVDGFSANLIRVPGFYALTAIAFSEIQRAVLTREELATDAKLATDAAEARTASIAMTHALLEDLVSVATSPDVNAVAAARDAIRNVAVIFPSHTSRIIDGSSTVLARRGPDVDGEPNHRIRCGESEQTQATLELWTTNGAPTDEQTDLIEQALEPASIAIENNAMLQQVAGIAIQAERVRLARELHDDIAPTIASVGLSLDMLLVADQLDDEQTRNVEATRSNVSTLVERIRDRVQDLRADRTTSLTDYVHSLVAAVDTDGPTVVITLDERLPPRPAIAAELRAMISEIFRNALDHADATVINIEGRVDEGGGSLTIMDNGTGFDADAGAETRFGLVGVQERARLINGAVNVKSSPGTGTLVLITWRNN
jgi:signal transduction histidine kinase